MKKRLILLLIVVVNVLSTGCTVKDKGLNIERPITVSVWHYYNGKQKEAFDNLLDEFNQTIGLEKGIIVTAESKGDVTNLEESIMASVEQKVGSEKLPDIFSTYTDTAIRIHQMELLADISEYISEEELKEYNPSFLDEGRLSKDGLEILPVAKATELLYLNKTDWDTFAKDKGYDLRILSTWEGIKEVAEVYYEWSDGKTFFGRDAAANFMLVGFHQLGEDIFQELDGEVSVILEEDTLKKIWDIYAKPYIKGYYGDFGRFRSDDLKTGDLVAAVGSTSSVAYYPNEVTLDNGNTYPIEIIVLPLPNFHGMDTTAIQQGAGMAVIKSTREKERATVEFLKWFTSVERNISFCINTGYLPVKTNDGIVDKVKETLKSMDISSDTLIYENTMLGLEAILSETLYFPMPYEQGSGKRSIITRYLTEELEIYKKDYDKIGVDNRENFLETCYVEWSINFKAELMN